MEETQSVPSLLMQTKYAPEDQQKLQAATKLAERCINSGKYEVILNLILEEGIDESVREVARSNVLRAAYIRRANDKSDAALEDIATRQSLPGPISWHAGMALVDTHSGEFNEEKLTQIAKGKYNYEVRIKSSEALVEYYSLMEDEKALKQILEDKGFPSEVRVMAGNWILDRAMRDNDYRTVLELDDMALPIKMEDAMKGRSDHAVRVALKSITDRQELLALSAD